MEILLEELYKTDIIVNRYHPRKILLEEDRSYQISGVTQSGKTKLIKNHLLSFKKNSYLYIDCLDMRIDVQLLNETLPSFCARNNIDTIVFDNYTCEIKLIKIKRIIVCAEQDYDLDFLEKIKVYPLDYEEFLAYEHKYDSSALNHFFQLGGFASMHKINSDERVIFIQKILKNSLSEAELDILIFCAKQMAQKISPYSIYERLKQSKKISKDKLYKSFEDLNRKNYIYQLQKIGYPKATRKIYLCDISLKHALSTDKNFGKLFENMIFLELIKSQSVIFYDDGVDFYLPQYNEIILAIPFANERVLFKKIELLEAFIFSYDIKKITVITMSAEGNMSHPISTIEMIPFDIWAITH